MPALLARSQSIEVERFTAFGPRFFDESLKLRTRTRIVYDLLPMLVALCKLTQFIKHNTPLLFGKFRQFLDDFRCAHGEIIVLVGENSRGIFPAGSRSSRSTMPNISFRFFPLDKLCLSGLDLPFAFH